MVVFTKKGGKNASFFINSIARDSNKNHGPDNVQRADKSPESLKTGEKQGSFTDHNLGNIQNVTSNILLINTPLFHRNIEKIIQVDIGVMYVPTIGFFKKNPFLNPSHPMHF